MATGFKDRITTGLWKGRPLLLPDAEGVRPSKQRVRQAVFNLLGSRVELSGASVADLCCGSGAWGLEAASRGAAMVALVDVETRSAQANVKALEAGPGVTVHRADARQWAPPTPLDVVLADPPYGKGMVQALLLRRQVLGRPGSWWVVETGPSETLDWTGFESVERRAYGQSVLWVAQQQEA